jgi:isopentenyl-diphosphate delta-isomerase
MPGRSERVSFDDEPLILVDEAGNDVGFGAKADVHAGEGVLHRAFSVFLFDARGLLLMQQRSADKPLWPLYWSNSCCSHPRRGETELEAARRRLREELGVRAEPEFLFRFTYHARYGDAGSEHELCSVFLARSDDPPRVNEREIAATRWVGIETLDEALRGEAESYTPWLKLEWARMRRDHGPALARYARSLR